MLNPDFAEMLVALSAEGVEYMAAHGVPRATGDIDIWVRPKPENAERVLRALGRFGAPLFDLTATDLARKGTVFQLGVPPRRIDILTSIDGVTFDEAWPDRVTCRLGGVEVTVIGHEALVRNKRAAARPKDLVDLRILEPGAPRRSKPRSRRSRRPKRYFPRYSGRCHVAGSSARRPSRYRRETEKGRTREGNPERPIRALTSTRYPEVFEVPTPNPLRDSLSEQRFPHLPMFGLRMKPYAHTCRAE